MLSASYALAAAAIVGAAAYLALRLRMYVTTATMLLGSLLLIYGPLFLTYSLSQGEAQFLVHFLSYGFGRSPKPGPVFATIGTKIADLDSVLIAMNLSIALMYAGIIAGIELVDRLATRRVTAMKAALREWNARPLADDEGSERILLIAIVILLAFMLTVSIIENQAGNVVRFLALGGGDNAARNALRLNSGGSPIYSYRLVLNAIAPMFVIWGLLSGWQRKSWILVIASTLLFVATFIGKSATLSKAPPAFFLIQLGLAALLIFSNRITWRIALAAAAIMAFVLYGVTRLIMVLPEGTDILLVVYNRAFEATNQALLENFAVFPALHPFRDGAGIRPVALLMGVPFLPNYSIVAHTWYGNYDVTSPALFIADAWADFSYAGVALYSVAAGVTCRGIDAVFLGRGKSVVAIAVLGATFVGICTLLTTALNTALLSGGLLLAPALAGLVLVVARRFNRRDAVRPSADEPQQG